MFKPQRILELIESNKLTKKDFCKRVEISVQTLDNTLKGAEIGSRKLERIADFFNVSIDYFFDRDNHAFNIGHQVTGNGNSVSGDIMLSECQKEIMHLKELLNEKERLIQVLMKR
ncbi:helix-turn-helix domain-containing protein [Bacteroides ilei]|uniref:helix-turn-helix domain-containing protein n=1 Tax=Bacteroides ilei TaxID=1907658 RepID=UPI000931EACB|nr:helix-turn-helix transcriptional regulator [Bacteroides ilei]